MKHWKSMLANGTSLVTWNPAMIKRNQDLRHHVKISKSGDDVLDGTTICMRTCVRTAMGSNVVGVINMDFRRA
ncbi:hypothetical protein AG1IA_04719 [Rhizoctonia solani AG-1 IA]|uniref:Uncharacterized protein n=1 Tax=Thanatephorus cucumeris (strain AG1-IA) TaxID=983506 RepID=L8WT06_THACA|nr:hypothetical protein AG1IA_04719 [Rhizoctonia solani AG-1 IA]